MAILCWKKKTTFAHDYLVVSGKSRFFFSCRQEKTFSFHTSVSLLNMADYTQVGNGVCSDKTLVKATGVSQVVITVQGPQEMLTDGSCALAGFSDPTWRRGRLRQAPSYLLGKPLHDFDATGNGVSRGCFNTYNIFVSVYSSECMNN